MNILFFTSSQIPKDGWSVVGYNIVKNLNRYNIEAFSSEEKKKMAFNKKSCKSELFSKYKYFTFIFDFLNVLYCIKKRPDHIHCNVEHYAVVAMWLSRIYGIPYTITAHGTYGVLLPKKFKIYRKAFKLANKVICVSNFTNKMMKNEKITANYTVIKNGVDKNIFVPDFSIRKENIITFVGNLKDRKGLDFLLQSMAAVSNIIPNIKVVVIGYIDTSSDKYKKVINYINKNKLNVYFAGIISEADLIKYYQKAKLNILPSKTEPYYFEGYGLIHAEANACGTLTVGTKNSGNEDAISKENGFLIDFGDIPGLANIIIDCFSAKIYPAINFNKIVDWKNIASDYENLFNQLKHKLL